MSKLRIFLIYFSMVVSGLVLVNVSFRYFDHFTMQYYLAAVIGMGLTISGFLMQFIHFLKDIKLKKERLE